MTRAAHQLRELERHLAAYDRVVVAFSGGVDSTLLTAVAARVLGDRALAVTVRCQVMPAAELRDAQELAATFGARHELIDFDWLGEETVAANPPDRCYHCKKRIFQQLLARAAAEDAEAVIDGTNVDDLGDYRPGLQALTELGVRSPFVELGLGKAAIRDLSRLLHLPRPERPSQACLASRVPYGVPVTAAVLARVEAAEEALHALGFEQVRVRDHGEVARLEVSREKRGALLSQADEVVPILRELGYVHVALDLRGYRTGSLNEALSLQERETSEANG